MDPVSSRHEEGGASDRRDSAWGWLLFLDGSGPVYTALGALLGPTNNLLRRVLPPVMVVAYYPSINIII